MIRVWMAVAVAPLACLLGCSSGVKASAQTGDCSPGESDVCDCADDTSSTQVCVDGTWGACACSGVGGGVDMGAPSPFPSAPLEWASLPQCSKTSDIHVSVSPSKIYVSCGGGVQGAEVSYFYRLPRPGSPGASAGTSPTAFVTRNWQKPGQSLNNTWHIFGATDTGYLWGHYYGTNAGPQQDILWTEGATETKLSSGLSMSVLFSYRPPYAIAYTPQDASMLWFAIPGSGKTSGATQGQVRTGCINAGWPMDSPSAGYFMTLFCDPPREMQLFKLDLDQGTSHTALGTLAKAWPEGPGAWDGDSPVTTVNVDGMSGLYRYAPSGTATPVRLRDTPANTRVIAVDKVAAWGITRDATSMVMTIIKIPLAGGPIETVASTTLKASTYVAADAQGIYWTEPSGSGARLMIVAR